MGEAAATAANRTGSTMARSTAAIAVSSAAIRPPVELHLDFWYAHAASATRIAPAKAAPKPIDEVCCARTHSSHAADAYIGNANTCFSVSIQAPGFGSARRIQGANDSSR